MADTAVTQGAIVPYLPFNNSDRLPLLLSLYVTSEASRAENMGLARIVADRIKGMAPALPVVGKLPPPESGKTILMICHSQQTAREAMSLAETRPVIVWSWLLDEHTIADLQQRLPVVCGPQHTKEALRYLHSLRPSEPDPGANITAICHAVEHRWGIHPVEAFL